MTSTNKILIVDDSDVVRLYVKRLLEKQGFEVHEACNGVEGVELALREEYAVALVDINMAKMDGYEFVRTLRSEPNHLTMPIIMISSEHGEKDRQTAYQSGANFYLVKPVKPEELMTLIRLALGIPR